MTTSGPIAESPIECALRLANGAVEKGLIGGYAVAGAFAFIAADALDDEALREAIDARVGRQTARILTAEHAVAIAVRTGRPRDHMKIAHLLASAPEAVDRRKLESLLERHHLLEAWRRLQPEL